jgi:DNA polymerase family A
MFSTPNIRSCILPDPGMILVEPDLRQADAQVVAWESDEATMKDLLRRGIDIYTETETGVWDDPLLPPSRQTRKNCVHSVNYGAGKRTLAERYVGSERAAADFIRIWFAKRPGIRNWQRRVEWDMEQSRTPIIHNIFGYRRIYACATPLTQPLAWIGQSTISIVNKRMLLALDALDIQLLAANHDSVLMQLPARDCPTCFPSLIAACSIPIPYPDPLTIPVELKYSEQDWGHMQKWSPQP